MSDAPRIEYQARCRIVKRLARGGMGDIYLAEQEGVEGFRKTVAIKTVRKELLADERTRAMFMGEARLTADLLHQNILQIYQLEQAGETFFIVMEYLQGPNLGRLINTLRQAGRAIEPDYAAFIISRVCRGLHYAHHKTDRSGTPLDLVHRDVTPSNILINWRGVVKICDFGIAKAIGMDGPDETQSLVGKWPYIAPEQLVHEPSTPRTDLFQLGLCFYELLAMQPVYPAKSREEITRFQNEFEIGSIRRIRPDVPPALETIVMGLLSKDPAGRPATAKDVMADLEHFMYDKGYGPTEEKLAGWLAGLFPEAAGNAAW